MSIGKARVQGGRLALRIAPNTSNEPLLYMPDGSTVDVWEHTNNTWWKVRYMGKEGYAMLRFLTAPAIDAPAQSVPDTWTVNIHCASKEEAETLIRLLKSAGIG